MSDSRRKVLTYSMVKYLKRHQTHLKGKKKDFLGGGAGSRTKFINHDGASGPVSTMTEPLA